MTLMASQDHETWMIDPRWTAEFVVVTPEMARQWLDECNTRNRKLIPTNWESIARAIRDDQWVVTGASFAFDVDGILIDGQNRAKAIAESGKAVVALVVRGLDPAAQDVTDIGTKRTLGHQLQIRGERNYSGLAAVLRYRRVAERMWRGNFSPFAYTVLNGLTDLDAAPIARDTTRIAALAGGKAPARLSSTLLGGVMFALLQNTDAELVDVERFCSTYHAYNMGKAIPDDVNDPVWRLRELIAKRREGARGADNISPRWLIAVLTKTWNVWIVGDTVAALKFGTTEKFPAPVGLRQQLDDAAA